jgi:hypothetical protein
MKPVLAFGRSPFRLIPTAVALVLMAACLLGRDAAHAQTSKAPSARPNDAKPKAQQGEEPELRGEWRRAGAGFACTVKSRQQIPPEKIPEVLPGACLYLGPFGIGKSATTVKARLGEPHRTVPQQSGAVAWMYFLEAAGRHPHLAVTVREDRIIALQLTGSVAAKSYGFNSIDLGASTETLIKVFGPAQHLNPSSQTGADLWSYGPWPFSFEITNDRVSSIRIHDPGSK